MMGPERLALMVWINCRPLVSSKNWRAASAEFRLKYAARPWNWLPPDLVTRFRCPTRANSAVLFTVMTVTSWASRMSLIWFTALSFV